jgi:hypothetical protein
MFTKYHTLFLALVFVLCIASIDAYTTNITFKSLIPMSEKPVYFECGATTFVVPGQGSHIMSVSIDNVVSCQAYWKLLEATINAFDPNTDLKLYRGVYWLIRSDGLFKSLNNFNFDKVATWKPRSQ